MNIEEVIKEIEMRKIEKIIRKVELAKDRFGKGFVNYLGQYYKLAYKEKPGSDNIAEWDSMVDDIFDTMKELTIYFADLVIQKKEQKYDD